MNLEFFIAKRVAANTRNSFSGKIMRIAIVAIMISMAVMIIATALVSGFKKEISDKIFGFWGHIHINHYMVDNSIESIPISMDQDFYRGGQEGIVPLRDVDRIPYYKEYNLFGNVIETETLTKGGIRHVQVFANKAGIIKTDSQLEGIVLKGIGKDYDWDFLQKYLVDGDTLNLHATDPTRSILISESTSKRLKVGLDDTFDIYFVEDGQQIIRRFKITGVYKTGLEEYDKKFALVDIRQIQKLNSWAEDEVSGFEVFIDDIRDLDIMGDFVYYTYIGQDLYSSTIRELYPGIFGWLELQDVNERLIVALMIIVSVINMTTALMILILERTNMIGTLKSLGIRNWSVRKIFLYHATYIIGFGLVLGNLLGIGICLLQHQFGLITLPEESYYVSVAPVNINLVTIALLNIGTLVITVLVLIIPSYLVTRIEPVKAIRFK
ncbi:MAG: FtsX-like permease family protein [Bacteroidota bacterium]